MYAKFSHIIVIIKIKSGGIYQKRDCFVFSESCLLKNSDMMVHLLCQYLFYDPPIISTVISNVLCLGHAIISTLEEKLFVVL